jgi:hypothetical protein
MSSVRDKITKKAVRYRYLIHSGLPGETSNKFAVEADYFEHRAGGVQFFRYSQTGAEMFIEFYPYSSFAYFSIDLDYDPEKDNS